MVRLQWAWRRPSLWSARGRVLKAGEALALGLIDAVVEGDLLAEAIARAPAVAKRRLSTLPVPAGDPAEEAAAAAKALKGAKGVPAIAEAIRVITASRTQTSPRGLPLSGPPSLPCARAEAKALRHLFLAEREAVKVPGLEGAKARSVSSTAVIGAGTMGAGIAVALLDAGYPVILVDRDDEAAAAGVSRIDALYGRQVKSGRIDEAHKAERLARLTPARLCRAGAGRPHRRGCVRGHGVDPTSSAVSTA